mgnify:CR=1 FL=1
MGHEHEAHVALLRFGHQEPPDLGLRDGVEHGGDLVCHQIARVRHERTGYAEALQLATRKLVREPRKPFLLDAQIVQKALRHLARLGQRPLHTHVRIDGRLGMLQDQLEPLKEKCEILLVDGGSTDGTLEKIRPWVKLLHSEKGRARQMNLGAENSNGEILFFLHCDSELPPHPLAQIRRVMQKYRAGCFGIAFHSRNFFMFTCRVISNHRVKDRKIMFGDQGIFLERSLFFEAGMFPEIPIMEDYQFSLTLKEMGIRLGMTRKRIYTSDRRFPAGTVPKLRLMWKMNRLRKMYRARVPIEQIARLYRDAR